MVGCRSWTRRGSWIAAAGLVLVAGCGWFEDPTPEQVRVVVTGDTGKDVTIVVSQAFNAGVTTTGGTQVQLFAADTLIRPLPFDTVFVLVGTVAQGNQKRFFFEASRAEEDVSTFQAQIYLDADLRFDRGGSLRTEPYRFAYVFNQQLAGVVEVI